MKSTKVYSDSTLKDSSVTWQTHTYQNAYRAINRTGWWERDQGQAKKLNRWPASEKKQM